MASRRFVRGALAAANLLALRGVYTDLSGDGSGSSRGGGGGSSTARSAELSSSLLDRPPRVEQTRAKVLRANKAPQSRPQPHPYQNHKQHTHEHKGGQHMPSPDRRRRVQTPTYDERDPAYVHDKAYHQSRNPKKMHLGLTSGGSPPNPPNFTHYYIHIPKTGGVYARSAINDYAKARRTTSAASSSSIEGSSIMCDRGMSPVERWATWPTTYGRDNLPCGMYMTEGHTSPVPRHVYTVLRDPREHVLSQYFHCTESRHHTTKADLMPDRMEDWLEAWGHIMDVGRELDSAAAGGGVEFEVNGYNVSNHEQLYWVGKRYKCYNPIDMQTTLLGLASRKKDQITKADLTERFDVVGITSQLDRSVCLIFIRWSGTVPKQCDCSRGGAAATATAAEVEAAAAAGEGREKENDVAGEAEEESEKDGGAGAGGGRLSKHERNTHSVVHHGATYNATARQLEAIDRLTEKDRKLYKLALELFEEQVTKVEEEYGIQLC